MYSGDIDKEKIQAYINYPIEGNGPVRKILIGYIGILFFIALPIFIFCAANGDMATIFVVLLVTIIMSGFVLFLRGNINKKKEKIILLIGILNVYASFTCLFAIYKMIATVITVSFWYVVAGILFNIFLCLNFNRIALERIRMGYYYHEKKKNKSFITPAFGSGLAILIGKIIGPYVSQSVAIIIVCLILFSFYIIVSSRTHNLLKYYFIRTLNLKIESEWVD
jgi:hypothetical protein